MLNPAATEERIKKVAYLNPEMLYYGMRKGVTGAKNNLDPDIEKNLQYIETYMKIPLAVGWGISTPGHIRDLPMEAHTAIVGSKTTDVYNLNKNLRDVDIYITKMVKACKK